MIDDRIEKESVVTYHYKTPLELRKILLKYAESHDVKIVGRLVEYQEVGRPHQHRCQLQPATLSPAERAYILLLLRRLKHKSLQPLHGRIPRSPVVYAHLLGIVGDGVDHPLVGVKLHSLLAVVAEAHRFAYIPSAAVLIHQTHEHLYECGFAGTVAAYDAKLLVTREHV